MSKSIIITFDEADENLLTALFKKFKVKTATLNSVFNATNTPPEVAEKLLFTLSQNVHEQGFIESISDVKAAILGEKELQGAWDLLSELKEENAKTSVL